MRHRVSIFDFSTLEAMYHKKPVILSDIEGNDEFNKEKNICMISDQYSIDRISEYIEQKNINGKLNYDVYQSYFSEDKFVERYHSFMDEFINYVENF